MSHLKCFAVGYVKIDRSFVSGLGKATNDEIVVSGMMSLVRALRTEAIAEGRRDCSDKKGNIALYLCIIRYQLGDDRGILGRVIST